jgi:hypothetical protein
MNQTRATPWFHELHRYCGVRWLSLLLAKETRCTSEDTHFGVLQLGVVAHSYWVYPMVAMVFTRRNATLVLRRVERGRATLSCHSRYKRLQRQALS